MHVCTLIDQQCDIKIFNLIFTASEPVFSNSSFSNLIMVLFVEALNIEIYVLKLLLPFSVLLWKQNVIVNIEIINRVGQEKFHDTLPSIRKKGIHPNCATFKRFYRCYGCNVGQSKLRLKQKANGRLGPHNIDYCMQITLEKISWG